VIAPQEYTDYVNDLIILLHRARALGLYRTAKKVHKAVNEARSETFEAMPHLTATINFIIGPVTRKE
jgi:hypothetical protein